MSRRSRSEPWFRDPAPPLPELAWEVAWEEPKWFLPAEIEPRWREVEMLCPFCSGPLLEGEAHSCPMFTSPTDWFMVVGSAR